MFNVYFGNIKDGRILRLPYLGYSLLLTAFVFALMFIMVSVMGGAENLMAGELAQTQQKLLAQFGFITLVVGSVVAVCIIFASINLMAKRLRDMGLPGWWSILVIILIQAVVSSAISEHAAGSLHLVVWLALLFVPSNTFGQSAQ